MNSIFINDCIMLVYEYNGVKNIFSNLKLTTAFYSLIRRFIQTKQFLNAEAQIALFILLKCSLQEKIIIINFLASEINSKT